MAEQTPTTANGTDKIPWGQTEKGRAKLSAIAKKARKEHPHSTRQVPERTIRRLGELIAGGATIKTAAKRLQIGYSTAQRYARNLVRNPSGKPKTAVAKDGYHRLTPGQIKRIETMLRDNVPATIIAVKVKCHLSSVYTYRKRLENEGTAIVPHVQQVQVSAGIPARGYMELKHANKVTWEDSWNHQRELTDGEMYFTMAWRRLNSTPE